jgi:hypothetical protein
MMDYDELIKPLRFLAQMQTATGISEPQDHTCWMAADAIETLRRERDAAMDINFRLLRRTKTTEAERDALRALLREAGEVLEAFANSLRSYHAASGDARLSGVNPRVGDLRRARAVLEKIKIEIDNVDGQKKD